MRIIKTAYNNTHKPLQRPDSYLDQAEISVIFLILCHGRKIRFANTPTLPLLRKPRLQRIIAKPFTHKQIRRKWKKKKNQDFRD